MKNFNSIEDSFFAFTLAEVLITLGIIGIVAALTIPTLMQNANEKATVTALKKAYSTLSQAYTMAVQENGTPDNWGLSGDGTGSKNILDMLAPKLKIQKNCEANGDCFPDKMYKTLGNGNWQNFFGSTTIGQAQLADGSLLVTISYADCNTPRGTSPALQNPCGWLGVDTNGAKNPNQLGVDFFAFYLTKTGIIPIGTAQETTGISFDDCKNKNMGYGCAAWVIYNENLDYLKCASDLSWTGKTKCD